MPPCPWWKQGWLRQGAGCPGGLWMPQGGTEAGQVAWRERLPCGCSERRHERGQEGGCRRVGGGVAGKAMAPEPGLAQSLQACFCFFHRPAARGSTALCRARVYCVVPLGMQRAPPVRRSAGASRRKGQGTSAFLVLSPAPAAAAKPCRAAQLPIQQAAHEELAVQGSDDGRAEHCAADGAGLMEGQKVKKRQCALAKRSKLTDTGTGVVAGSGKAVAPGRGSGGRGRGGAHASVLGAMRRGAAKGTREGALTIRGSKQERRTRELAA